MIHLDKLFVGLLVLIFIGLLSTLMTEAIIFLNVTMIIVTIGFIIGLALLSIDLLRRK